MNVNNEKMINLAIFTITFFLQFKSIESIPSTVNIGILADKFTSNNQVDVVGSQTIAAILLAIRLINDKREGYYDNILPNTTLLFALRETKGDFLVSSLASQHLALTAFNGLGVKGVVGTGNSVSSRAMGQTFAHTPFKICNIDFGANNSDLSHGGTYPLYARTFPSDGYDGRILARVAFYHFGWSRVNVFSTADAYGSDTSEEFLGEAQKLGIFVENRHTFWPGTSDFTEDIERTKANGILKVFVIIMDSVTAGRFLEAGYNSSLFTINTQILGTQYIAMSPTWQSMSQNAPVGEIMRGVISVRSYLDRNTPNFQTFLKLFLSQKDTKVSSPSGVTTCDNSTDDDGGMFLYRDAVDGSAAGCAGIQFSALNQDGSDVDDQAAYAFDAALGLAHGLHNILYRDENIHFTGEALADVLLTSTSYDGATGHINFFEGYGGSEGYALGDRQTALTYRIMNFNPNFFHRKTPNSAEGFRTVGYWDTDTNVFTKCQMNYDDSCANIVFNSADGQAIRSDPTVKEVLISYETKTYLKVFGSLCLITTLVYVVIWLLYSDSKLLRASQPSIMFVVLLGGVMGSMHILLSSFDATDATCMASMWLAHLSFALVFAALLAKTWRLSTVLNSGMARTKITASHMHALMSTVIFLFGVVLVVDTFLGKPHRSYDESFDGHSLIRKIKCKSKNPIVTKALFGFEAAVLLYSAKLTWDSKSAPDALNDSTSINLALYWIAFVCAITFPIVFLSIQPTPENLLLVMSTGFIVAILGVINVLFGHRTFLLLDGADVNEDLKIVRDPLVARSSGERASNMASRLKGKVKARLSSGDKSTSKKDGADYSYASPKSQSQHRQQEVGKQEDGSCSVRSVRLIGAMSPSPSRVKQITFEERGAGGRRGATDAVGMGVSATIHEETVE